MPMRILPFIILAFFTYMLQAQNQDGPQLPVTLEHADSLVGSGPTESGIREFLGSVRFVQGNVTVSCDRAVHNVGANQVDLYGRVVIRQGAATIYAPLIMYSGVTNLATATKGMRVVQGNSSITSKRGTYSTLSHIATFLDSVVAVDDSVKIWADTLVYDRSTDTTDARGRVVISDSIGFLWLTCDHAFRNPRIGLMRMAGNASSWQWDSVSVPDTLYIHADTLLINRSGGSPLYHAMGSAELVRGSVAARADSMYYAAQPGRFEFYGHPVLWSDSLLLVADTIVAEAPQRQLQSVIGNGNALLISLTDTLFPDRFDQISGRQILMEIEEDTVRRLLAVGGAQSITFRMEEGRPEGLAKVASDTIRAVFETGNISDVYWLGGIEGEHHPEPVVAGREQSYRLPGFVWRTDRPLRKTRVRR